MYRTIAQFSEGFYKEKGSKFLAFAVPCSSEKEAKVFLASWREKHPQACHVCYAYRFGADKKIWRANDDGEPANSAGAPIFGQIQAFDLSDVLIGVVRYYGGTNLGVGGLKTAYKTATFEALTIAKIIETEEHDASVFVCSVKFMPKVMTVFKRLGITIVKKEFSNDCSFTISYPTSKKEELYAQLRNIENPY